MRENEARAGSARRPVLHFPAGEPTLAERREALRQALHSSALDRADQLRRFLTYVVEAELAGDGADLNEYRIGIEALGKPANYSTTEDSSVRRCAHALRRKLEQAYAGELSQGTVRIELPLGSYQPRFLYAAPSLPTVVPTPPPGEAPAAHAAAGSGAGRRAATLLGAFTAGALLTAFAWFATNRTEAARETDPLLLQAWGPLAGQGATPLVCLAAPPHYGILAYPEDAPLPHGVTPLAGALDVTPWWRARYPLPPGHRLATHLTSGPIRLGEVLALVTALHTLGRTGAEPEVVAEKYAMLPTLRRRNLLLLGNPEYSHAAAELLARTPLTVAYDVSARDRVVRSTGEGRKLEFVPRRDAAGAVTDAVGLLTVLPGEAAADQRMVIVSCTHAGGCEGAMEYFSSPSSLAALLARFRSSGLAGFPRAYQVVVRSKVFRSAQATSGTYETHLVVEP